MRPNRKLRAAIGIVLVVGAVGYVLARGLGSSIEYFQTANQAVANRAKLGSETFNIEGAVVPGSIHKDRSKLTFSISSARVQVPVVSYGSPPQLFQAKIPVVLSGHFDGSTFVSDQIMVKHSASYVAAHPDRVKSPYR